ncbi:MAG: hypothetical protein JXM72_09090 [Deltaproteobacteria bacterium]|nr:hypothetical protein [Deltaproteobacteria bacterium]
MKMNKTKIRWLIIIPLLLLALLTFSGAVAQRDLADVGWSAIMVIAALGLIFNWQWTRYAFYLLAITPILVYLRIFISIWHSGGLYKYPERATSDIIDGIITIPICLVIFYFVFSYFKSIKPIEPNSVDTTNPINKGRTISPITFDDVIKGLLFILLMIITYIVVVKVGKYIFNTFMGSTNLPFIIPLILLIVLGYACIAALAKAVESGFSLNSLFRRSKNNKASDKKENDEKPNQGMQSDAAEPRG